MNKPPRKSATHGRTSAEPARQQVDPVEGLVRVVIVALWLVRWLIPTESAAAGDTLWIAQSWFAVALLWAWGRVRQGDFRCKVDAFDLGLWMIIAGHFASAAGVFAHGGDRRAAIDLCWEWTSIGVAFFLTRQTFFTRADGRRLATAVAALAVLLAGLGISQPFLFYKQALNEYRQLIEEFDRLSANPNANADRLAEVTLKLDAQGIPTDVVGRRQYEDRLRNSNEPFGPFALANSFAGFLAGSLFIARGLFRSSDRPLSRGGIAVWTVSFLLIAYCLVLTKSRTAWAGVLCGFAVAAVWEFFKASGPPRRTVSDSSDSENRTPHVPRSYRLSAIGIAVALALIALAFATRGLDRLVLSEVPKSFGYRLQYWSGAVQIIREHPLLGIGPGNFRPHYLRHKVPEASEEIADPHQFLLDLWTSGGLMAVAGLVICGVAAIWLFRRPAADSAVPPRAADAGVRIGGLIAFGLACASGVLAGTGDFDPQQLPLMLCWWLLFEIFSRQVGSAIPITQLAAAAVALLVHMSGAGGIEMPALVQLLWTPIALASARDDSIEETAADRPAWPVFAAGGFALFAFLGCLYTATIPVLYRRAATSAADQAMILDRSVERASEFYQAAAAADPFSNEPLQKLADLYFSKAQSLPLGAEGDYDKAAGFLRFAAERNPFDWSIHRRLGEMMIARFTRTRDRAEARAAAEHFAAALARYPNNAALRASRASALASAGDAEAAREEARRAIELDEINHRRGHSDRYLADAKLAEMQRLATP